MKKKIWIDTDIGSDVDDALALALALRSPELEIVGISTVYRGAAWRAGLVRRILKTFGREDIPVFTGASKPLNGCWEGDSIPDSGKDFTQGADDQGPCAGDSLLREVERDGEELTVAAIGPLTNIGLALARASQLAPRVRLVMMGGQVTRAHPEWNIVCDPEAARIVFESGAQIRMVGLDVTNRCTFSRGDIERFREAGSPQAALLWEMLDRFVSQFHFLPVLHDPLALSSVVWDDLLSWEDKRILIETGGVYSRGLTLDCDWERGNNASVATDVRVEEFRERLLSRIAR